MIDKQIATIETSVHTGLKSWWCQTRKGRLIRTNGLARGTIWDGLGTPDDLGITAPASAPTVASDAAAGGAIEATYTFAFRYIDADGIPSSLSPVTTVDASEDDGFDWSSITASSESRVTQKELYRSVGDGTDPLYLVATISNVTTTYGSDNDDDDTVAEGDALVVLFTDGTLSARRFEPPPTHTRVCVRFQDRYFYAVNAVYKTGTVAVTNASGAVTGTGTDWTDDMEDRKFYVSGGATEYTVSSVVSGTSMTISPVYAESDDSAASYAIHPGRDENDLVYFSHPDEPESVPPSQNYIRVQENTPDSDEITGLIPAGAQLYCLKTRHVYRITFVAQPTVDANVALAYARGCVNQWACALMHGTVYLIDAAGPWAIDPDGGFNGIGDAISDQFLDNVNWSQSEYFFTSADHATGVVRFFVILVTENVTRPQTCYAYNTNSGQWWKETYFGEIGAECKVELMGRTRTAFGCANDTICIIDDGPSDIVAATGQVTSADSTSLTNSSASFISAQVGAEVTIVHGTGVGQKRTISSVDSGTKVTVSEAWYTNPDTSSRYSIPYGVHGTATGGSSTTLVDSSVTWPNEVIDAVVAIVSGTGVGQSRRIKSVSSNTITVQTAWTTTPDTTSKYVVGAIEIMYRSGKVPLMGSTQALVLEWSPTTLDAELRTRLQYDHASTYVSAWAENQPGGAWSQMIGDDAKLINLKSTSSSLSDSTGYEVILHHRPPVRVMTVPRKRYARAMIAGFVGKEELEIGNFGVVDVPDKE